MIVRAADDPALPEQKICHDLLAGYIGYPFAHGSKPWLEIERLTFFYKVFYCLDLADNEGVGDRDVVF